MAISRKSLEKFKLRTLRNLEDLKSLGEKELDYRLKEAGAVWRTPPMRHQKVSLLAGLMNPALYLLLDPGLGKGHPIGTRILTRTGFKKIEELTEFDLLFGEDGKPKKILGIYPKGRLSILKVTFTDGSFVLCDEDHLWKVEDKETGEVEVKKIFDILSDGVFTENRRFRWSIPITKAVEFPEKALPLAPYLMGVLLANGSLKQNRFITYITSDEELVAEVDKHLPPGIKQVGHVIRVGQQKNWNFVQKRPTYSMTRTKTGGVYPAMSKNVVTVSLSNMKLYPILGTDKFIPTQYKLGSIRQRLELLQGLMDCDGIGRYDVLTGGIPFYSRSKRLAYDTKELVESLGGTATITVLRDFENKIGRNYCCYLYLPADLVPFKAKAASYKPSSRYLPKRFIEDIRYVGQEKSICLSVEDSLYLTEHCIVTHNTKVSLDILASRQAQIRKTLVLVPGVSNIGAWLDEIKIHAPNQTAIGFYDMTKAQKAKAINDHHNIVVMTYMGWLALLGISKRKGKRVIDEDYILSIEKQFQMVIWDEADALKSSSSLSYQVASRLVNTAPYRLALSGTPFDKNPIDLWSQFYLLDYGYAMGENITLFRKHFCIEKYNPYSRGFDYVFDKRKTKDLSSRIRHTAIVYSEKECLDLPDTVGGLLSPNYMVRSVPFSSENERYYRSIVDELKRSSSKEELESVYTQMRNLTAGYMSVKDLETGKTHPIPFDKNPKIEALLQLISEIPDTQKIIVFNEYKVSGKIICDALDKHKIKHVRIFSGTSDKDKINNVTSFKKNPATRILVGSRSICYGLNLQEANYLIIFESPDSTIKRQQLERRIRRHGQKQTTYIYDLAVAGSVDIKILKALRSGKSLIDDLLSSEDPSILMPE